MSIASITTKNHILYFTTAAAFSPKTVVSVTSLGNFTEMRTIIAVMFQGRSGNADQVAYNEESTMTD